VDINSCYSALNRGKLRGFVDFIADRFDVDNHCVTYVRGNADEATKEASTGEYVELVEDLRRRRDPHENRPFSSFLRAVMDYQRDIIRWTLENDRMYVPCKAGKKMIVVNERADVLPCEILNQRLGSLKEYDYDLTRLLANPQALQLVEWIRDTRCHCTFECALATSLIFHKPSYPRIAWRAMKRWLASGRLPRPLRRAESGPLVSLPVLP
jgi:MoaA/NifB/PqqE/SkfB family radical SAM enzyme